MKFLRDTWLIFQRQTLLVLRNPTWVVVGIVQPLFYLFLFGPLLKRALAGGGTMSNAEVYRVFVPGMLVMLAMFGTFFAGFGLIAEVRAGIIERSRVTPLSRFSLLLGRSLRDMVTMVFQCGLITVLAIPLGLSAALGSVLLAFLVLALIALMLSAVGYGLALKLGSEDALAPLLNTLSQPLLLLSGVLLPMALAPSWLQTTAKWNPFYWGVDATRHLFASDPGNASVWKALLVLGVLTVVAVTWAARSFARSVR